MCGIIGYVGFRKAAEVLLKGLKDLEYRGYDSVGIAVKQNGSIKIKKDRGMIDEVASKLDFLEIGGNIGIGHTRWATHGEPSFENAHPHSDCEGKIALVHNGVIENFLTLREEVIERGHKLKSDTDTEIIAHLIEEYKKQGLNNFDAFRKAVSRLEGSYAIACLFSDDDHIYLARKNSPLIIGIGKGEMFCASDFTPMLRYTKRFIPLDEGEFAVIGKEGYEIFKEGGEKISKEVVEVNWSIEEAEKGGYPHYMLKEIEEQKYVIAESFATPVEKARKLVENYEQIDIVAAGTSYHAGLMLKYLLQKYMNKNVDAVISSEYPYWKNPTPSTLVIAISQSGETADTLQAVRYAKSKGAKILGIANVVGSTLTRIADEVVYINAGPEISVAATKTFTSQLAVAYKLVFPDKNFEGVKEGIAKMLEGSKEKTRELARKLKFAKNVYFVGRGMNVPIAMEGALKFKEISYIHAEAYPAGEFKHGPLSLIEKDVPVIFLLPKDETYEKAVGNVKELKARGAYVVAITDDEGAKKIVDEVIPFRDSDPLFNPFLMTIPLQLIAYYTSVERGINPDKPRNLAKSVTVE